MSSTTATKPATTKAKAPAKPAPKATPKPAAAKAKAAPAKREPKEQPEPQTLLEALTAKKAVLIKQRANGTERSLPYLKPGSPERLQAEVVAKRAETETIPAIAESLGVSLATARRFLTNLALAQAVEAGEHDAAWTAGEPKVVVQIVVMKAASK